jgi:small nuclear ribonucleoprotein
LPSSSQIGKAFIQLTKLAQREQSLSQISAKKPLTTLQKNTKKKVTVRLKNEVEYKGKMDNVDSYMNLIMTDAEELHDGKIVANYGRVIVRGNNVLFIKLENEL